jgi:ABC-type amino acid transport substrate-binding protein
MSIASADQTLRVRVADYAPMYFQQNEKWTGVDVELAEAILKDAGFTPEYVNFPWSRALSALETGDIDVMLNFARNTEREAFTHFIGPTRTSKRALAVHRDNVGLKIGTIDELADAAKRAKQPVCILANVKHSQEFDARLANDRAFAEHFYIAAQNEMFAKMVASNRCLGFFGDVEFLRYRIKTDPDFKDLAIHPYSVTSNQVYLGVTKKRDAAVIKKLDESFRRLEANGTLAKIRAKWGAEKIAE